MHVPTHPLQICTCTVDVVAADKDHAFLGFGSELLNQSLPFIAVDFIH